MIYLAGLRLFVFGVLLIVKKAGINSFPVKTSWGYILNYLEFPKSDLPVKLPDDVSFDKPGNPLDHHPTWKHVDCPTCGKPAERETDTFDTFVDSAWYFARFCCPKSEAPLDAKAQPYHKVIFSSVKDNQALFSLNFSHDWPAEPFWLLLFLFFLSFLHFLNLCLKLFSI